ncbi:glutathione S-transferase [Talaromyces proteolyticus]|uniref:Glutathione S-transferase n=1 Tax=Talaromyces proteolyticus TaxID=1131652 RepID=A0AAD4KZ48_9EURO|nr:glutathione S-transferase [Talaromyces proteolyticus]KAH8704200.1 glutathione S-transferase [Talaromyces proteolyticus]
MPAHPDADLYPTATGPAKDLVDQHQTEQSVKLYAGWFCPFGMLSQIQRVWLALEEKQIPYQYIEVNPYDKPDSLLKLNPRGLVPTLQVPDPKDSSSPKPLYESNIVLEYLEEAFPDNKPHFLPKDPYEKARARIWIDYVTSRVIPAFHRFLQYQPGPNDSKGDAVTGLDKLRAEFRDHLKTWIKEADPEGPYFLGKDLSLPDLVLAPWAVRLWVFEEYKGGLGLPAEGSGGVDELVWQRWRKWLKAVESRKSVQQTTSEKQHYLPIYKRYVDNVAQSELAKATRAGRGVP